MSLILNGLRVVSGTAFLALAAVFLVLAAGFEQSYDSGEGVDVMMTSVLGAIAIGLGAGGLAFLPLRWEPLRTAVAAVGLLAFGFVFVMVLTFMT